MIKKIVMGLLIFVVSIPMLDAATFYSWRYREHATDCTALTDGKVHDMCFEIDAGTLYKCVPDAGDCSGAEWILTTASELNNLETLTTDIADGEIVIGDGAGSAVYVTPAGDVTIANDGTTAIGGNKVQLAELDVSDVSDNIAGAITEGSLADGIVVTDDIKADNITSALIADDQIDSEHYVNGSIDAVHLAADVIDETKIADNGIDSEHYNNGSVDAVHLASDVTLDVVAENGGSTDVAIDITATNASTIPLTVKGAASQISSLLLAEQSDGTDVFQVRRSGSISNNDGVTTSAVQYGAGLFVFDYGEATPEHINTTGSYDHTGGTYEKLFTNTEGDNFEQADADTGAHILMVGDNIGAIAEIKEFINEDNVVVSGYGWDGDFAAETYFIIKHPIAIIADGAKHEFSVNSSGEFEVQSYQFTGSKMMKLENDIAGDESDTFHIQHDANGYANTDAVQILYTTGDLQTGDENQVFQISVDESGATDGKIDLLFLETTDAVAGVEKDAIHVSVGFDTALTVSGATADDMDYGYEYTAGGSPVSKVVGDDSFINTADDEEVLSAANDYILIGNDAQFEVLQVILATPSSKDLDLEFYYSNNTNGTDTGVDGWTQFYPDDATQGFTQSGNIDWTSAGAAWDEDDLAEAGEAITEGYYIAIKRTRVGDPPTDAVEDIMQIYLSQSTGMNIDGLGVVQLPYLGGIPTGGNANGKIWTESDGVHAYYNGGEQVLGTGGGDAWGDAVDASIVPTDADDTYDLGSGAAQFKDGYFDGTLEADVITEGGTAVWNSGETDILDSGHYIAESIDLEHMSSASVDSDNIVDNTIANADMADNSIDSDDYVDGSVDAIHLAADIIDETKIADDGIDSEHYNDGSIDEAHLNIANAATDEYVLSYEADTSNFQWKSAAGGYTTLAEFVDESNWQVFYTDGSGDVQDLTLGADGTYLMSNGATSAPSFETPASGSGTWTQPFLIQSAKITGGDITNSSRIDAGQRPWRGLFDDTTEQEATWQFVVDPNYAAGTGTLEILFSMDATQSGDKDVKFDGKFCCVTSGDATDFNTDCFDSEQTVTHDLATDQADDLPRKTAITFTQTQADEMAVDDICRFYLARDPAVANDATGDVQLLGLNIHE